MRRSRYLLLTFSIALVVAILASGMAVRVGADDGSYRETVQFAEIMSTILEYYVDQVDADALLRGAYEGMLGGLDPNGAFLTAEEVGEWRRGGGDGAGPGFSVLKVGRVAQVVAVDAGSAAAEAGVEVGDHLRKVGARPIRDLSLLQIRRLLAGPQGSQVRVELLRPGSEFETLQFSLTRSVPADRGYSIEVRRGVAIVRLTAPHRVDREALLEELDDIRSRGVTQLLLDLRNAAEAGPRTALPLAECFGARSALLLRDKKGRVTDSIEPGSDCAAWRGSVAVLINGATAGAAEALTSWIRSAEIPVFGQSSYGLGAEPSLYTLEDGAGLLVSTARWETADGTTWNDDGIDPDREIDGEGEDYAERQSDQLERVLDQLEERARLDEAA